MLDFSIWVLNLNQNIDIVKIKIGDNQLSNMSSELHDFFNESLHSPNTNVISTQNIIENIGKAAVTAGAATTATQQTHMIAGAAATVVAAAESTKLSTIDPLSPLVEMLLKIVVIVLISTFVAGFLILLITYQHIKDNVEKYRCEAWFIPVAAMFDVDPRQNMARCNQRVFETYSGEKMNSVYWMLGAMGSIMGTIGQSVQAGRMALANVNLNILNIFNNIYNRIKQMFGEIVILISRIRNLIHKVVATFVVFIYAGMSGYATGVSIWNSFIGATIRFFCFSPTTPIKHHNGAIIPINTLRIGDKLANGDIVLAIQKSIAPADLIEFRAHGMIFHVHPYHKIRQNDGTFSYAFMHPDGRYVTNNITDGIRELICITTTSGKINIGDYVFTDYQELTDPEHIKIQKEYAIPKRFATPSRIIESGFPTGIAHVILHNQNQQLPIIIPIEHVHVGDQIYDATGKLTRIQMITQKSLRKNGIIGNLCGNDTWFMNDTINNFIQQHKLHDNHIEKESEDNQYTHISHLATTSGNYAVILRKSEFEIITGVIDDEEVANSWKLDEDVLKKLINMNSNNNKTGELQGWSRN